MDPVTGYLYLSALLFALGVLGVLVRQNTIIILMCVELMLNAVNIAFVALSMKFQTLDGQIAVFFVMSVAAAEVAVGLAIVITLFRNYLSIETNDAATLRG
ncbi:MAG: NADH-quinone oxidoreductase subunit NuoK [Bdellovibrionales bacterium]|nr:NADH-quinone oxidoreductase subunit NuoK [Bdellovibrionales bacterium]